MLLKKHDVILFNGDSITDALRDRADKYSLAGYSKIIADELRKTEPSAEIVCYNRGVGGDTSAQLLSRLEGELNEIRPTVFSLLIGVNDTWRRFDSGAPVSCRTFEGNLNAILALVKKYTERMILLQPFLLDTDPQKRKFRKDLDPKIQAVNRAARKYATEYVPLDGIFAEACCKALPAELSYDGVHPTEKGHELIAAEWLKRVELTIDKEENL